jgi:hypothetical protein
LTPLNNQTRPFIETGDSFALPPVSAFGVLSSALGTAR